jgi:HK97 family phage prohead protease
VFNQDADISGLWRERIRPGAFKDSLKRSDLVYALWNHDPSQVLARNVKPDGSRGGLRMHEDRSGLKVTIRPYDTPTGREVLTLVREGGIDKMSFAFTVEDEVWSRRDGVDVREITKARLFDVSPVTFPAYEGTSISARALEACAAFAAQEVPITPDDPHLDDTDPAEPTDTAWEAELEAERLKELEVTIHGIR